MNYVEYDSNNSGGDWWLSDEDWYALEKAGWQVRWERDNTRWNSIPRERFLGALATSAKRYVLSKEEAIAEWERITGQDADEPGCNCCGQPHYFSEEEEA